MTDVENMREVFYSIEIGSNPEQVWIKKLRNILNSDIHNKPLGCKIDGTHVKIGEVHLGTFYEAQLLFSHAKWIHRFANWLANELSATNEKYLIVGYETYIEPLLSVLHNLEGIDYCIFEEPKFIQRNAMSKARIRCSKSIEEQLKKSSKKCIYKKIVFLCGISSTLSTFKKLQENFLKEFPKATQEFLYYSVIQVLPNINLENSANIEESFSISDIDKLTWNTKEKKVTRNSICVRYLVDVTCDWQIADKCEWCFPEGDVIKERPLITTGDTSVIPLQMIGYTSDNKRTLKTDSKSYINFFKKEKGSFKYIEYLYYNHIDRDDHHFQYYIRTGSLFNKIMEESTSEKFNDFCQDIKKSLKLNDKNISIIVTPLHFSNERFSHEINRLVFENKAHIISFDPKKEYRSNFETKYSNYAYVLEQINSVIKISDVTNLNHKINFYFVDDQVITGDTFYRAKSFVHSLMNRYSNNRGLYNVFHGVITLIDRNSNSTRFNYVEDINKFFSFIKIPIPSIRNYGDSCPLCKQIIDAENISDNCTLDVISKHWGEKAKYHKEKTIEEAKTLYEETSNVIKKRHFVRFYCECLLWEKINGIWGKNEILKTILLTIRQELRGKKIEIQYEYLISFLKVVSRPFLFYRENVKKVVLEILLSILQDILNGEIMPENFIKNILYKNGWEKNSCTIKHLDSSINIDSLKYHLYSLICIVISCLSNIDSCYLLNTQRIIQLCDYVSDIDPNFITFEKLNFIEEEGVPKNGFYLIIVNNFKKLICGVSGTEKSSVVEKQFIEGFNSKHANLFKVLYLENIRLSKKDLAIESQIKTIQDSNSNIILKYEKLGKLCENISNVQRCLFFLSDSGNLKESRVAEIFSNTRVGQMELILEKIESTEIDIEEIYNSLYSIGYYEFNYQHFLISLGEHSDIKNKASKKNVLMLLSFDKSCIDNYTLVKKWLIHRKTLNSIIKNDINTGALESAIRAKAAEYVLSTDKTQSHGQSSDINKLFEFVYEKFVEFQDMDEERLVSSYQAINLFVNRCIGFGATKQIFKEYFELNNMEQQLQPFCTCVQRLDEKDIQTVTKDLEKFFNIVVRNDSLYISEIKEYVAKKNYNSKNTEDKNIEINLIQPTMELIKTIKYVPLFINVKYDYANTAIFLIGIIDIFIRNAIEHSPNDCKVTIKFECGDEVVENKEKGFSYHDSYSFTVINNSSEKDLDKEGFTKKFFTQYLFDIKEGDSCFYITMCQKPNGMYESKLICIVKDLLEETL